MSPPESNNIKLLEKSKPLIDLFGYLPLSPMYFANYSIHGKSMYKLKFLYF